MSETEQKKEALRRLDKFGGSILTDLFIANKKNGVKEGFRRLALLLGTVAFAISLNEGIGVMNLMHQGMYTNIITDILSSGTVISISVLFFIVVATLTRAVGWIVEGFLPTK